MHGYPLADYIRGDSYLNKECDILFAAAEEMSINKSNVHNINCKILVEAANGPVTSYADEYLQNKKKVLVLPDILVNSGAVISSYFEWLKNLDHRIPGKMTKRVITYKYHIIKSSHQLIIHHYIIISPYHNMIS